ncbi:MAG: site-2 protease family protein [bacterium]|nr:site-2 protease family protein [bacterium]
MLNEPASFLNDERNEGRGGTGSPFLDEAPHENEDHQLIALRTLVASVLLVEREEAAPNRTTNPGERGDVMALNPESRVLVSFYGRLTTDSEKAYAQLDAALKPQDLLPVFRRERGQDAIHIIQGRVQPAKGGELASLILFVLTVLSVLYLGTTIAISELELRNPALYRQIIRALSQDGSAIFRELWRGLPYAASILLILGAHEMGHYLMSRRHKVAASLPYFIPFPFGIFGTFGAAIRLREPMRNRKMLFDIGAAGPLAGLIFAIPILLIGLATSYVGPVSPGGLVEGNSLLYALAKVLTFGRFLPSGGEDVFVNQLAWAGWTGLFVTGLNLIPIGQLDGGHVLYSLIGSRARRLYYPVILIMGVLVVVTNGALLLLLFLILFLGRIYAVPLDDITPLDPRRRMLAVLTLVIFAVVFVPVPLSQSSATIVERVPDSSITLPVVIGLMWLWHNRLHLRRARLRCGKI